MALNGVSLTEINAGAAESAEQDQTARMCRLILLYILRKMITYSWSLTLSQTTDFGPSKPRNFADDKFKFDEDDRKFSKWVENTVGKGEIARDEHFLLFPLCFQETCSANT